MYCDPQTLATTPSGDTRFTARLHVLLPILRLRSLLVSKLLLETLILEIWVNYYNSLT